jgi:hypothetical protein
MVTIAVNAIEQRGTGLSAGIMFIDHRIRLLRRLEFFLQEGHHRGIECEVKGRSVEAFRITADLRCNARERRRAGRQEGEMARVRHHAIVGLGRQRVIYILGVVRVRQDFVAVATPELYRGSDVGKPLRREGITDGGCRDHRRRDAGL